MSSVYSDIKTINTIMSVFATTIAAEVINNAWYLCSEYNGANDQETKDYYRKELESEIKSLMANKGICGEYPNESLINDIIFEIEKA